MCDFYNVKVNGCYFRYNPTNPEVILINEIVHNIKVRLTTKREQTMKNQKHAKSISKCFAAVAMVSALSVSSGLANAESQQTVKSKPPVADPQNTVCMLLPQICPEF